MRVSSQDIRLAFRLLRKAPGTSAIILLSLALGIGATVTVAAWHHQLVASPLPGLPEARAIAVVASEDAGGLTDVSYADFRDFRDESTCFRGLVASRWTPLNLRTEGAATRVYAQFVSWNYFETLEVRPALGRGFLREEDRPGAPLAVVLSHDFWMRAYGGDPAVLGRSLRLNGGLPGRVVGVAPARFQGTLGGLRFDLWVPLEAYVASQGWTPDVLENRRNRSLFVLGRLAPGATLAQAQADLDRVARELERRHPEADRGFQVRALDLAHAHQGAQTLLGKPLSLLLATVLLVLLIASANVANLLLVRSAARQGEWAVRAALGADRAHIVRQILLESLVLALLGGAGGLLASWGGLRLLRTFALPSYLPVGFDPRLDGHAVLTALACTLGTTFLVGLLPALLASDLKLSSAWMGGERTSTLTRGRKAVMNLLVAGETALAVALLVTSALTVRSLQRIRYDRPGFEPRGVLVASPNLERGGYTPERARRLSLDLRDRLQAVPGVRSVAFVDEMPMSLEGSSWEYVAFEGRPVAGPHPDRIYRSLVSPGYFRTLGIPLAAGRDFSDADGPQGQPVAIVNEALARRYWPGQDPVGKRLRPWGDAWWTVVGVAKDARFRTWFAPTEPLLYLPIAQGGTTNWNLVARTDGPPSALIRPLEGLLRGLDPALPLTALDMERYLAASSFQIDAAARILAWLGILALVLAGVGIFAMVSHAVEQRRPEIGIRMALGARAGWILRDVLGRGLAVAGLGIAAGWAGAYALAMSFANILYRTEPWEPPVFLAVSLAVGLLAALACALPALRAARVDPCRALRRE